MSEMRVYRGNAYPLGATWVRAVNAIRRAEPALQFNDRLRFHETDNAQLLADSKVRDSSRVLVVVNLDPRQMQHGWVHLSGAALGIDTGRPFRLVDLQDSASYVWTGDTNYVNLDPAERVAHVFTITAEEQFLNVRS